MVWLKFYDVEQGYNGDLYKMKIHTRQAQRLVNKLTRHFKIRWHIEVITNSRTVGHAYYRHIDIPKIATVGLVIHELAHIFNRHKYGKSGHTKKLHSTIKRFSKYFRNHLLSQFSTLEVPKPKPKPTPLEKAERKLSNKEASIKRLTTKIKTLKTRLRTAKKKRTNLKKRIRTLRK